MAARTAGWSPGRAGCSAATCWPRSPPRADPEVTAAGARRTWTHRPGRGRRRGAPGTTWWSTAPHGPQVDAAEAHEGEAFAVNAAGPAHLASGLRGHRRPAGARVHRLRLRRRCHRPLRRGRATAPRTAYGRTKAGRGAGGACRTARTGYWIVRTAWLYGAHGPNFVRPWPGWRVSATPSTWSTTSTGSRPGRATSPRPRSRSPTPTPRPGSTTAPAAGETTWYGLARAVFELLGADPDRVRPTTSDRLRPARAAPGVLGARAPRLGARRGAPAAALGCRAGRGDHGGGRRSPGKPCPVGIFTTSLRALGDGLAPAGPNGCLPIGGAAVTALKSPPHPPMLPLEAGALSGSRPRREDRTAGTPGAATSSRPGSSFRCDSIVPDPTFVQVLHVVQLPRRVQAPRRVQLPRWVQVPRRVQLPRRVRASRSVPLSPFRCSPPAR